SSSLDVDRILGQLLEHVLRVTGAELAMVLLKGDDGFRIRDFQRVGTGDAEPAFSRSVVEKVAQEKTPLCILDADSSSELSTSKSMLALGLKSILCVPIESQDSLLGILYVSSGVEVHTFTPADLDLLRAIAAHAGLALYNAHQFILVQEKRSIESELSIAHSIQQGFFPRQQHSLAGLEIVGSCQAAREVGGDYYDIIPLADGRVALTLGDVSGKGISASLYMAVIRTAIRMALRFNPTPEHCLIEVNRQIHADIKDSSFVTCFLGIYDPASRELVYVMAGHRLGYWKHQDAIRKLEGQGVPLGLDPAVFDRRLKANRLTLDRGDYLLVFTDGVLEALDPDRREFGEAGILGFLRAFGDSAEDSLQLALGDIARHVKGAPPWDDMTLLVARVEGA
ncbi:MAG: SpoIIE family protein phosphatase, partial [Cyanobacteria bacterium REEB65]|nr:SpoIIE family protein phosphatase [Cyanobacteria bacterium REEB65]